MLSSCPAATVRREGDKERMLMYKADTVGKRGLNSYLFFSPFFPCFQIAASPPLAHGCAHARTVLAGEGTQSEAPRGVRSRG